MLMSRVNQKTDNAVFEEKFNYIDKVRGSKEGE